MNDGRHCLFLQEDGTVKSSGYNYYGQCGEWTGENAKNVMTTIPNLTDVVQAVTGEGYSLFLLKDGTVKSCGQNGEGQCGIGDVTTRHALQLIPNLTDVVQVAAGNHYSLFLLKDGTVKSCGYNGQGTCGMGNTTSPKLAVTTIPDLTDVVQIAAGSASLFLLKDGTVKSCGYNGDGACGMGNMTSPKLAVTTIPGLTDVVQIAAGHASLFLLKDGTVKSCGQNAYGECGMGNTTSPKLAVTTIPDLTDVVQVVTGDKHSLFLLKDGTVKSCGYNGEAECGMGNTTSPKKAVTTIPDLTDVAQVTIGIGTSLFLLKDGTVKSCGRSAEGGCGTVGTANPQLVITAIPDFKVSNLYSALLPITPPTEAELAIIALNTDAVTKNKVNTAIGLFGIANPTGYTPEIQTEIALLMPKKGDPDFVDYTPENLQERFVTATHTAKEHKSKKIKRFYSFLSKLPSMKI